MFREPRASSYAHLHYITKSMRKCSITIQEGAKPVQLVVRERGRDNFDADSLRLQESHTYSYILVVYAYG